jgi:hypothetical protein
VAERTIQLTQQAAGAFFGGDVQDHGLYHLERY